jgi:hypothetical protein
LLSESDSIKIFMASTKKTINIVGANVLALVDRKQCKVNSTLKLNLFLLLYLDCYSYQSCSIYQGTAVSMPIPYNVGQYRTSDS